MPKTVKMKFIGETDDEPEVAEGTFPDDEWNTMFLFVSYAGDLRRTEIVSKGGQLGLKFDMSVPGMLGYEIKLPPDDHIAALLHRLRPFVLQNERTNFNAVGNFIARRLTSQRIRQLITKLKSIFSGEDGQRLMQVTSDNTILNSEEILMKWLYAHEYHRDEDKQAELAALHAMLPLDASKVFFVSMLHDKSKAILALANLIEFMNGGQERIAFRFQ